MVNSVKKVDLHTVKNTTAVKKNKEATVDIPMVGNKDKKIKDGILKGLASGVITKGYDFFGIKFGDDYYFQPDKYKKLVGEEPTLGEISKSLGLKPGDLKKENPGLFIGTFTSKGGPTLDGYTPSYAGKESNLKLPYETIQKYLSSEY